MKSVGKRFRRNLRSSVGGVMLAFATGFFGGCAGPSPSSTAPKPGRGIAEYRQVAHEVHGAVAATVKSIEGLEPTQSSLPPGALARFDQAFEHLELTSFRARSRAEAIIARGRTYFEEWRHNLVSNTNQLETERYDRLFHSFIQVQQRSGEMRDEFRPFMAELREFRARLDRASQPAPGLAAKGELNALTTRGRRVLETLASVSTALDLAETELKRPVGKL